MYGPVGLYTKQSLWCEYHEVISIGTKVIKNDTIKTKKIVIREI